MNTFPFIHTAKIFYLQCISLGLYIQLMRFQINVKWIAFKLLFSLEAWHWKREGFHPMTEELLPDPLLHSVSRAVMGNAIHSRHWWVWEIQSSEGVEKEIKRSCEEMLILTGMKSCVQEDPCADRFNLINFDSSRCPVTWEEMSQCIWSNR